MRAAGWASWNVRPTAANRARPTASSRAQTYSGLYSGRSSPTSWAAAFTAIGSKSRRSCSCDPSANLGNDRCRSRTDVTRLRVDDEGRIPIWQYPTVITTPGKYIVTRNITQNPGMPVIDVLPGTVAVDIDLNGFTLYGLDFDVIRAQGVDSLTVRNGSIHFGLGSGIWVEEARKVIVEDVKIEFVSLCICRPQIELFFNLGRIISGIEGKVVDRSFPLADLQSLNVR